MHALLDPDLLGQELEADAVPRYDAKVIPEPGLNVANGPGLKLMDVLAMGLSSGESIADAESRWSPPRARAIAPFRSRSGSRAALHQRIHSRTSRARSSSSRWG